MSAQTVLVIDDSPTILKVVELVLAKAGFAVKTAPDGEAGLEAARRIKPDLILLDFVMPKMNGYQVCRELSQDRELKDVAVVLMSAKGDQVGERFVKVMGIVDYITKPFSPEAITAVVQHSITKYSKRPPEDHTKPLLLDKTEELEKRRGDVAAASEHDESRQAAFRTFRTQLEASLGESLSDQLEKAHEEVALALRAVLDDDKIKEIAESAEACLDVGVSRSSLRGDLAVVPIAEVLQLLGAQRQSGILRIARGSAQVEVSFRNGAVDLATASNVAEEFLLGRFLVASDLMTDEDLESFLDSRAPSTKLMGSQLVKLGYLSEDGLKIALTRQTRELVYEALRWSFGTFHFIRTRELPLAANEALLGLDVEGILMEGFRRVDEWHLIEREVDDFDKVYLRNEDAVTQMGKDRLTREELAVLELVNGKHTVKEIIRSSRMGSFEVSKMLYRLLSIKLIRPRVQPVAV